MSFVTICDEQRKARKPHRCIWCGQTIVVGSQYQYVRGVFEGDPQSNHYHLECSAACIEWAKEEGGDCEFMPFENERPSTHCAGNDARPG